MSTEDQVEAQRRSRTQHSRKAGEQEARRICLEAVLTRNKYPITNTQGKVKRNCLEADFTRDQYGISNKEGKVRRRSIE